ncbi:MAG: hypothetical protein NNA20_12415 [Nitrospira sp.]|nr:hypothetical protein [Nitrospira sp.]
MTRSKCNGLLISEQILDFYAPYRPLEMYQLRSLALDQLAFFCLQQRPANGVHGHAHLFGATTDTSRRLATIVAA